MGGFFSRSSSKRRYPDPNMGGTHYKKKGLFGMLSGLGSSFSGSGSYKRYGGYPNQGYPNQNYGGQGYPNQNYGGQGYPNQQYGNQGNFQPNTPASAGQAICPKCGASVPAGSKFCLSCGEKMTSNAAFCPNCGKPLQPGAKFCSECGTKVQ
ncbi:zinc-ribbon domain-containing protein [Ruminococcus sp. CLA-AA-H200]|uniref:Zinc-ribbon domain-containing protein n=1 Tax=Ruminococcus turbiniformis TaxID=2881258 RepID=A0ABS8FSU6_9FIRM|nr:zinc ribbon domain-containing protein [Ruminococcus turbiniformis]MCC2253043.1 zinc-ribbon domain-containing protein [Ruminococcus turbiniformis]